ncbi:hypothetical protein CYY_008825 [Polysphondylium violaceum]|uniref:SCP domain-containing protein n=1 Tax=Polysphondylium violaceum TaxID=133409 RepID=A0A8J4PMV6_9MYCE|nr:hypothetical protein CYY_008825 [Polysphondylium violaceum]
MILIQSIIVNCQTNPLFHLSLVNRERAKYGLEPLVLCNCLIASAQAQSDYQSNIEQMTHNSLYGDLFERIEPFDIVDAVSVAENVACGQRDDNKVFKDWMRSYAHRQNILGDFNRFGVAVSQSESGDLYWSQHFANAQHCNRFNSTTSFDN